MHHFTPLTSHVFLFVAFIQFASNSPHIQSCTMLAKKNTPFTFCSSSSSSSPPSCYIITAAISKPRATFLRPSRGDMTFMHRKLERRIGPKRANDKTRHNRFGDFSAPKVLFSRVRVCEAYAAASLTATFFFLFPLIYHDWAPLPNRNASATAAAAMTQDLYSAQIFASRNWLDDRLTNAAWRRRRKRRKRYVLQTSNAWNYLLIKLRH